MTPNKSLELSCRIRDIMKKDLLQFIEPIFPSGIIREYELQPGSKQRDRVFNKENTLLTMIITALHADKSLQNSVRFFQEIFQRNRHMLRQNTNKEAPAFESAKGLVKRGRGRPRLDRVRVAVSKLKDISSNTAAFSKARKRVDIGLISKMFKATTDFSLMKCVNRWHGRLVYNTDGTYFQMQDTPEIPSRYRVQKNADGTPQGYPQGLLQVLTQHGSGLISAYRIAGRNESELALLADMTNELPEKSLLLADDLYNCYAMFCLLRERGIDIIIPDKKNRNYRVIKRISSNDEIVEITKPTVFRPLFKGQNVPKKITLRRITYSSSHYPKHQWVLLTTILDETIEKTEFICKFSGRWDIEITIREIKTIMDINIARSKSEDMVFREMGVALIAFNLIRKIIAESAAETPFPPETDLFQELYSSHKATLVDRKGRVYSRWSPGRPPAHHSQAQATQDTLQNRTTLQSKNKSG